MLIALFVFPLSFAIPVVVEDIESVAFPEALSGVQVPEIIT